jgi:cytosine/adenosine deaminase-related metal-dependent hydrolase
VLDASARRADLADMLVVDGAIREIGRPGLAAPADATVVDARDRLLIPGLINGHTHSHGALARGMPGDRIPLEILLTLAGAVNANRSVEDKRLSAQLSAIEMIRRGCTACYDMFVEAPVATVDGVFAAAQGYVDVGLRAVVAPMIADRTLYQALPGLLEAIPEPMRGAVDSLRTAPPEVTLAACRTVLEKWPFDRDQVRPALGPTIPLHCSDDFLIACRDLARQHDVGIQMHVAESRGQAVIGMKRYGTTLTAHLADLGVLGPKFSAAHAVWLDGDDLRRLADAGGAASHNPLSNLRLGAGVARPRLMLEHGVKVGIGTDSPSSADTQNMFEALRLASYLSRISTTDYRRWIGADEAFRLATEGSAAVLGMADRIGRLAPGYRADIVFLDLANANYVPLNDALVQLVFGENGSAVDRVMIDGRMVLDGGRILTVDEARLRSQAERSVARLREQNADALATARALEPYVGAFCLGLAREPYRIARVFDPDPA